jgi:hypothetical protein
MHKKPVKIQFSQSDDQHIVKSGNYKRITKLTKATKNIQITNNLNAFAVVTSATFSTEIPFISAIFRAIMGM